MKKIILILVIVLVGMEGLGWLAYKKFAKSDVPPADNSSAQSATVPQQTLPNQIASKGNSDITAEKNNSSENKSISADVISNGDASSFPPPATETIGGVVQRTIHMGVRQWEWDPAQISVNYGEKVILIMHNADVPHSIMIPELKVKATIPEEGAIVTFTADKRGTFDFFCAVPCGSGHSKMQGKITVN